MEYFSQALNLHVMDYCTSVKLGASQQTLKKGQKLKQQRPGNLDFFFPSMGKAKKPQKT